MFEDAVAGAGAGGAGPFRKMLVIPGAAKVRRRGHRENQEEASSAVGIQAPCLSGCGVP